MVNGVSLEQVKATFSKSKSKLAKCHEEITGDISVLNWKMKRFSTLLMKSKNDVTVEGKEEFEEEALSKQESSEEAF